MLVTADHFFVDVLRCRVTIERCIMVELFEVECFLRFTIYFVIVYRNRTQKNLQLSIDEFMRIFT